MTGAYILVVEDEQSIAEMITEALELSGYEARWAANGSVAYQMISNRQPDLVITDWMMPMMSGIELTRRLKRDEATSEIPVILLTARTDEDDTISGLESGADDYVQKPFSPRELVARIRAVLRRSNTASDNKVLRAGGIVVERDSQRCLVDGEEITLGPTEYRLLEFFMLHPDRVYSRAQLLDRVWGENVYVEDRTVDVHIRRVRKALSPGGNDQMIQTVRGAGYRFIAPDSHSAS